MSTEYKRTAYGAKSKNSASKFKDGEQWKGSTKWSIKLKRLKLVQHCIQLPIAKNKFFENSSNFYGLW